MLSRRLIGSIGTVSLTATCEGNQSAGLKAPTDFPSNATGLVVRNLTAPVAPATGAGIVLSHQGSPVALSLSFAGDSFAIRTAGNGIELSNTGDDGADGSRGNAGKAGQNVGSATLRASGPILAGDAEMRHISLQA